MTTKAIAPGKQGKQKTASRFQRLWAEAEALAKDNIELESELNALVSRIDKEVFSAEREMGETVRLMVYRQIEFANRKSLLKWQRAELNEWISDNLSELTMFGLVDEPLQNAVAELRAFQLGIALDPDSDLSAQEQVDQYLGIDNSDDYRDEFWDEDEPRAGAEAPGDLFDDDEYDEQEAADEEALAELLRKLHAQFEDHVQPSPASDKGDRKLINGDVFKRLFRQTAAALHPDRETDENRRQEKHALMSQLLKARKDRDLITIVKLHEQHTSVESALSGDDEQALEEVLVDYLSQQQARMDAIIEQSPMHNMAYSEFYSKKPATITRRINAHLRKVRERRRSITRFMAEVKTLKSLKTVLEERFESRVFTDGWFQG
jgi:hypothetical protein